MRFRFGDFELDPDAFELTRAGEPVHVEPQVFGVLACLVTRHERLVTRDELLDEVWGTRFVSDATVASRVKAARRAIGDDGTAQRLIRTVTGRGYRFVGEVERVGAERPLPQPRAAPDVVGREAELGALAEHWRAAASGSSRVVLVTGEAGAGKTALVEAFCGTLGAGDRVWVGHCLPLSAGADPYGPFLEALAAAARSDPAVVDVLARYAPTWRLELPLPVPDEALASSALGATQGRIVREFVAAIARLSERDPIVLVLEDLHWADEPTLGLLDALARTATDARLLVIGTSRMGERGASATPSDTVLDDLLLRELAAHIPLAPLSEEEIDAYVCRRVEADAVPAWLPSLLVERTAGNPLFLRCLLDAWLRDGRIAATSAELTVAPRSELAGALPPSVKRLIQAQLEGLDQERRELVEAASAAGVRFSAVEVAAVTGRSLEEVDQALADLSADTGVVTREGTADWPDGVLCGAYSFAHQLYCEGVHERVSPSRRREMHARIGLRLEEAYGDEAERFFAARLAHHFVEAGDVPRALRYLRAAASQSLALSAHAEAAEQANRAIALLDSLPDAGEAARMEIALRSILAVAHVALNGWAAPEIEGCYRRAQELSEATGAVDDLRSISYGLATMHEYRGEYERSEELMTEHLDQGVDALVPEALELLACSTFHQGRFARSLSYAERAIAAYDESLTSVYLARYGESPAVNYHCWAALSSWFLGRPDDSTAHLEAALAAGRRHAYSATTAHAQAAFLHQFRRDPVEAGQWAETTIELATEHDFPFRVAQATILRGWSLAALGDREGGAGVLANGLELYRATGASMDMPYYLGLQAEVAAVRGLVDDALTLLSEARAVLPRRGFFYEPQLLMLEAVIRAGTDGAAAASLLERAAAIAEEQAATGVVDDTSRLLERLRAGGRLDIGDLDDSAPVPA